MKRIEEQKIFPLVKIAQVQHFFDNSKGKVIRTQS